MTFGENVRRARASVVGLIFCFCISSYGASDDRTIVSIITTPDNTFDNQLTASQSDSGTYISLDVSGGALSTEDADNEGGYRVEYYNANGDLVRRRSSEEINAGNDPTPRIRWNGQGDTTVNDTVPYGAYTARAYMSMRTPTVTDSIAGSGITIDRPGDLHVTPSGILSWVNTGTRLSFCQITLGDPNSSAPSFLRIVDYAGSAANFGAANTNRAYGIAVNDACTAVYVSGNTTLRIAKYDAVAETWFNMAWATAATTSVSDDQWLGLDIDASESDCIYVAAATGMGQGPVGGGDGGGFEGVIKLADAAGDVTTAQQIAASADAGSDLYDVAAKSALSRKHLLAIDNKDGEVDSYSVSLATRTNTWKDLGANDKGRSICILRDGSFYVTNDALDSFAKFDAAGNLQYSVTNLNMDGAGGIAVWQKTATNETFIMIAGQTSNKISIYKEPAAGTTPTFVRVVEDDVNNLDNPIGIAINADSEILIVSRGTRSIKKFSKDGVFQPLVGAANGKFIQGTDNTAGLTDTQGFNNPGAIAVDSAGFIYVFDQVSNYNGEACIKRFSPTGVPDPAVWYDLDVNVPGAVWAGEITTATIGNNTIFASSREDDARAFAITLNSKTPTWVRNVAPWNLGHDLIALYVGPYHDDANSRFYPSAVYGYSDDDKLWIFQPDLSNVLLSASGISNPAPPSAKNISQPFLVDHFGEIYMMIDDGSAPYDFVRYNAATDERTVALNGLLQTTFTGGGGPQNFNGPRQAVWLDGRGAFWRNPVTQRYEQKIWINDADNNRLQQMLVEWNSVEEAAVTISPVQDTPIIVSATIFGDSVATVNGFTYIAPSANACTVQINFNHAMKTNAVPDTMTVQIQPSGLGFTSVTKDTYVSATWKGKVVITPAMASDVDPATEVLIRVADAYDNDTSNANGTFVFIGAPPTNKDQTDQDPGDEFRPFYIDKKGPEFFLTAPAGLGMDSTSAATTLITGQVTTEATGLNARIECTNWTALTGGTLISNANATALLGGSFERDINLSSAPSDNYIEVVAIDQVGNRTVLSPRRLVQRTLNVGTAYIEPSSETIVGSLARYVIKYTAGQVLAGETIRITVPAAWSTPQKSAAATAGCVAILETTAYVDSKFSGQVITITGVNLPLGENLNIVYGDSAVMTGRATQSLNAPLDNPANTFGVAFQPSPGTTPFSAVSAPSGKSLTVPLRDSAASVAVRDTGPNGGRFGAAGDSVEIAKGTDTIVMTARLYNTNLGSAHLNRLTQISFSVESDTGAAVPWSNVASRLLVTSDGVTVSDITAMPVSQTLIFSPTNLLVSPGTPKDLLFRVFFSPTATADTVRFFFSGLSSFSAVDSASGKALSMLTQETGVTGRKTGEYDIIGLSQADSLAIGTETASMPTIASTGQVDLGVMRLFLKNSAESGLPTNPTNVTRLILSVRKADGTALTPASVLKGVKIRNAATQAFYGGVDTPLIPSTGDTIQIDLTGLTIASNVTVELSVEVSIADDTAAVSQFRIRFDTASARDQVTNVTTRIRDDPARAETLPFQTDSITIVRRAYATLRGITPTRLDGTVLRGEMGDQLSTGEQFYIGLNWRDSVNNSALVVEGADSDFLFLIDGVNKSSEFTVAPQAPVTKTISPGAEDTMVYLVTHNGTTAGALLIAMADTTLDTRPRLFDYRDAAISPKLRAQLGVPPRTDTLTIVPSQIVATILALDTTYANPGKDSVPMIYFRVQNNIAGIRNLDSLAVEVISEDSAVQSVHLYQDNRNGALGIGDTLVASAVLDQLDRCTFLIAPQVSLAASGGRETFFVAFNFVDTPTDGDIIDARIPAFGVRVATATAVPSVSINSAGEGIIEVVATRVVMTPDTQIVATASSPQITFSAVDAFGNFDNVINYETPGVQGRTLQVTVSCSAPTGVGNSSHKIVSTTNMTGVTPAPGYGVFSINGSFNGGGQGIVTFSDTEAETIAIGVASSLTGSTGGIQFANLISAAATVLPATDSAFHDSKAVVVLAYRVTNQGGATDSVVSIRIHSLIGDTQTNAVMLFRDTSGNSNLDSGIDKYLATGIFSGGYCTFTIANDTIANGDSALYFVACNIISAVADATPLDAEIDSMLVQSTGASLVPPVLNSTPNRRIEVTATHIDFSPVAATTAVLQDAAVTVSARDDSGNLDIHYTGGAPKLFFDLTGNGQFRVTSTLANQVISPADVIKGNLVSGVADLVFTDATPEIVIMTVTNSPGLALPGTHDTGAYTFSSNPDTTPPAKPTGLAVLAIVAGAETGVQISWSNNTETDLVGYRVYRGSSDDSRAATQLLFGGTITDTLRIDSSVIPGETYYHFVVALDTMGNRSETAGGLTAPYVVAGKFFDSASIGINPGSSLQYRMEIRNDGFGPVQSVIYLDTIPANVSFRDTVASPVSWEFQYCTSAAPNQSWGSTDYISGTPPIPGEVRFIRWRKLLITSGEPPAIMRFRVIIQ